VKLLILGVAGLYTGDNYTSSTSECVLQRCVLRRNANLEGLTQEEHGTFEKLEDLGLEKGVAGDRAL
jgi:hypothetical protein